jgi:(p)ppGpp synthase/HD superfamily hydrolase
MPSKFIVVAYLHDIVEDTTIDLASIKNMFGKEISDAVDAMTKRTGETRKEYITRCSSNKIARFVKLQDAVFNASNCFKNKNNSQYDYYMDTISMLKSH